MGSCLETKFSARITMKPFCRFVFLIFLQFCSEPADTGPLASTTEGIPTTVPPTTEAASEIPEESSLHDNMFTLTSLSLETEATTTEALPSTTLSPMKDLDHKNEAANKFFMLTTEAGAE